MKNLATIIAIVILSLTQGVQAQPSWFGGLKTGGFSGRFNVGAGVEFGKIPLELSAWLGYTNHRPWNEELSCQQISLIAHPDIWKLSETKQFSLSAGFSGILYQNTNIFWKLPPQFPEGYYQPTNLHGLAHLGLSYSSIKAINGKSVRFRFGFEWVSEFNNAWLAISNHYPSLAQTGTLGLNLRIYVPLAPED